MSYYSLVAYFVVGIAFAVVVAFWSIKAVGVFVESFVVVQVLDSVNIVVEFVTT